MTVGERIKSERLARGWSQETLAKKAKMKRTSISSMELGKLTVGIKTGRRLARALKMRPWDLLGTGGTT